MPNIEIKETEYYNCPYCHRKIPDYAICNCVKNYNQALEDVFNLAKQNAYDDGVDYSIGLQELDELISNIRK